MTCLALGADRDGTLKADEDGRKRKAAWLKEFANDLKQFAKRLPIYRAPFSTQTADRNKLLK